MNGYGHIVSRFSWQTSFDVKDRAVEMQDRLSHWSRLFMPGEINEVFDRICPPDQVWRIQRLELDLGPVAYDEMEAGLAVRLREQLLQKLIELVVYTGRNGNNIEILDEDVSQLSLLRDFLVSGLLPWSHRPEYGSVNEMLAYQFQQHRPALMDMLRETGSQFEEARRRMAWQFSDQNVVRIIEGLEPANHVQVVDFTDELTKIQTRELIVQTGTRDFRKNLWYWVLTHLLTERGTIFNKVAFIRSSIRQMADHHNIGYLELMHTMQQVVSNLPEYHRVRPDFMLALRMLASDEKWNISTSAVRQQDEAVAWESLEVLLDEMPGGSHVRNRALLRELIRTLPGIDRNRFANIVFSKPVTEPYWMRIFQVLDDASAGQLLDALLPHAPASVSHSVQLLIHAGDYRGKPSLKKQVWYTGIRFLHAHRGQPFSSKKFFGFATACLMPKDPRFGHTALAVLYRTGHHRPHSETPAAATALAQALHQYAGLHEIPLAQTYVSTLMQELTSGPVPVAGGTPAQVLLTAIQRCLEHQPAETFALLQQYAGRADLLQVWPAVVRTASARSVLKRLRHPAAGMVLVLADGCAVIARQLGLAVPVQSSEMAAFGLKQLLFHRPEPILLATQIFGKFMASVPAGELARALFLAGEWIRKNHGKPTGIELVQMEKILAAVERQLRLSFEDRVEALMQASPYMQEAFCRFVTEPTVRNKMMHARKNVRTARAWTAYLLPGAGHLCHELPLLYTRFMTPLLPAITGTRIMERLQAVFWEVLFDYKSYKGSRSRFLEQYSAAVMRRFYPMKKQLRESLRQLYETLQVVQNETPVLRGEKPKSLLPYNTGPEQTMAVTGTEPGQVNPLVQEERLIGEGWVRPSAADQPGIAEIMAALEEGLFSAQPSVNLGGRKIPLEALLTEALALHPQGVREVFGRLSPAPARVRLLSETIGLPHLSIWLFSDAHGSLRQGSEALQQLYTLLARADNALAQECSESLVRYLWQMARQKEKAGRLTAKAVNSVMQLVRTKPHDTWLMLEQQLKKKGTKMNEMFAAAMASHIRGIVPGGAKEMLSPETLRCVKAGLADQLCVYLLEHQQLPSWYDAGKNPAPAELLSELLEVYPARMLAALRQVRFTAGLRSWIHRSVGLPALCAAIRKTDTGLAAQLPVPEAFYAVLARTEFRSMKAVGMLELLFVLLVRAWTSGNTKLLAPASIWNELVWDTCSKRKVDRQVFLREMGAIRYSLPPAMQLALSQLEHETQKLKRSLLESVLPAALLKEPQENKVPQRQRTGIAVRNAGIVILNAYVQKLFQLLDLLDGKKFRNREAQTDAVHFMQYLVTGMKQTEESLLPLNKVLCGLALHQPLKDGIDITPAQEKIMTGLLSAAIGHWPSAGHTTVNGFRGNWLVRDGLLLEHDDRWELVVEKRPYDVLISKSPFSFSFIRFPWMDKPLHVSWAY